MIWILKLIISHLLADFILQPKSWIEHRAKKHFASGFLYLHGLIAGMLAYVLIGLSYWPMALVIMVSHIVIDGWKTFYKHDLAYFITDQLFHLLVIALGYYFTFLTPNNILTKWYTIAANPQLWKLILAILLLTTPTSRFIGLVTQKWREKIPMDTETLANAGKWIGIVERIIVLILVIHDQYEAIGLIVTAKSILRFNERDRPEIKTEYLLIGTLLSIGIAMVVGIALKMIK